MELSQEWVFEMKRTLLKRITGFVLLVTVIVASCACEKEKEFSVDHFNKHENTVSLDYSFLPEDDSEALLYNPDQLQIFQETVSSYFVDYGYEELFSYEQAISGIQVDHFVAEHTYSALDDTGILTKEHLVETVKKNTAAYLEEKPLLVKEVSDECLLRICEILVDVVNGMLEKYPDIDKDRVYCNLGNLKVVEKRGALDYAAIEPGMVLHVNRNTANMVGVLTSSNMYNVLIHETMHIIQFGCECEAIDGCIRRCGLAHSYASLDQDYSDWVWLAEGSAERMACLFANVAPMTYQYKVNYILTMDQVTMLQAEVPVNYVETLYFYCDPDRLFDLFGAKTEAQKEEIYKMVYALEMMQMEPGDVQRAYTKYYGVEWTDEIRDEFAYTIKRPVVQTLTKCFFNNLAEAIRNNSMSKNDLLFFLNLYESTMNEHIQLNNEKQDVYNVAFVEWYGAVRNDFFACLDNVSAAEYAQYVAGDGAAAINASMKWLDKEKQDFLIAKFQDNKCGYKFN